MNHEHLQHNGTRIHVTRYVKSRNKRTIHKSTRNKRTRHKKSKIKLSSTMY